MNLGVVVPVRNDADRLGTLLGQIGAMGFASQVVVVDDGSDTSPDPATLGAQLGHVPLQILHTTEGKGAGHARNLGFQAVTTEYVLFFDADDLFHADFKRFVDRLEGKTFDMALFLHDDTRRLSRGVRGPEESLDRAIWDSLSFGDTLRPVSPAQARALVRISNYPWNKILRTRFARSIDLHFTEIPVHNDIEAHWSLFIEAQTILANGSPVVTHTVSNSGARLTNRTGADRLRVFEALGAVSRRLDVAIGHGRGAGYVGPFLDFYCRLLDWIDTTLDADTRQVLDDKSRLFLEHFARTCGPQTASAVEAAIEQEPGLGARLLPRLRGVPE